MRRGSRLQLRYLSFCFGAVQAFMGGYYIWYSRWSLAIPWATSLLFYVLWRLKPRAEDRPKRKQVRY